MFLDETKLNYNFNEIPIEILMDILWNWENLF